MTLRALFESARARRLALGLPSAETNAYRLFHGAAEGLEGLTVDVYGEFLVASLYTEQRGAREEEWLDALHELGFRGVYLKHRPKQANELRDDERRVRAPEQAVRGEDAPVSFEIRESSLPFQVRLGDGLSTGIFLDQRDNRAHLGQIARGKRVLNLFAYTCGFGLAAALGGAAETTNIDVAVPVLERGKLNYQAAGLDLEGHRFLARDVLDSLPRLARRGERFEIVALDPPSYASVKGKGRFNVEQDYTELARLALSVLSPGGTLLACTNHARLTEKDLEVCLRSAARALGRSLNAVRFVAPPADFPAPPGRPGHLKSAFVSCA
ncbi:MAG: class I SAM-dependent methyltransferase [Myxococcales bacterium]